MERPVIAHDLELARTRLAQFQADGSRISAAEEQFLLGAGIVIGAVKHLREDEQNQLLAEHNSLLWFAEIVLESQRRASHTWNS